jgi:hypothetical protein
MTLKSSLMASFDRFRFGRLSGIDGMLDGIRKRMIVSHTATSTLLGRWSDAGWVVFLSSSFRDEARSPGFISSTVSSSNRDETIWGCERLSYFIVYSTSYGNTLFSVHKPMMTGVEMPVKTTSDLKTSHRRTIPMHIESHPSRLKNFSAKQAEMMPKITGFQPCR